MEGLERKLNQNSTNTLRHLMIIFSLKISNEESFLLRKSREIIQIITLQHLLIAIQCLEELKLSLSLFLNMLHNQVSIWFRHQIDSLYYRGTDIYNLIEDMSGTILLIWHIVTVQKEKKLIRKHQLQSK